MIKVERSIIINKPVEEVFGFLVTEGSGTKWQNGVVDVIDEQIEGVNALLQPALEPRPLLGAHDTGHQVEWKRTLGAGRIAVDVERNPELDEHAFGRLLATLQLALAKRADGFEQQTGFDPGPATVVEEFVVEATGFVRAYLHLGPLPLTRPGATKNGT